MTKVQQEQLVRDIYATFGEDVDDFSTDIENFRDENEQYKIDAEEDLYGGEGQGEEYWSISKITIKETGENIFIRFNGYYESWEGGSMDSWEIVEPREVKVTQWFSKA